MKLPKKMVVLPVWGLVGCLYAGVSVERRSLILALQVSEGAVMTPLEVASLKSSAWVCCRGGEMVGAILPYVQVVGADEKKVATNLLAELDGEICRNYGDSRQQKFGRWYGFIESRVWAVGGKRGGLPGRIADRGVDVEPVACEYAVSSSPNGFSVNGQSVPHYVKNIIDELDRLGDESVVLRSGTKKLVRAFDTEQGTVFCDGIYEDLERLVLEYSVLASDYRKGVELACCWQLRKIDGALIASGVWRDGHVGPESKMIEIRTNESGGWTLAFRFGTLGVKVVSKTDLAADEVREMPELGIRRVRP